MSEEEVLKRVKQALGITGKYLDDTLRIYIDDITSYLTAAGVSQENVRSTAALGAVVRGVADIWNTGSGNGKLSPYFYEKAIQLVCMEKENS